MSAEPNLTRREAAARLGIGLRKLAEYTATGELPSIKLGSRRLYRPRDVEAFLDRHYATAAGDETPEPLLRRRRAS